MWAPGFEAPRGLCPRGVFQDSEVLARRITSSESNFAEIELKSLILAQIERWRHALHMQVERERGATPE